MRLFGTDVLRETALSVKDKENRLFHRSEMLQAAEMLRNSHKPLMLLGGGAVPPGVQAAVMEFARNYDAPIAEAASGRGAASETDSLYIGSVDGFGARKVRRALAECDLLFCIGTVAEDFFDETEQLWTSRAGRIFAGEQAECIKTIPDTLEEKERHGCDCYITGAAEEIVSELHGMLPGARNHGSWRDQLKND